MEKKEIKNIWFRKNGKLLCYSPIIIEFDCNFCYVEMENNNNVKFNLIKEGITFNDNEDKDVVIFRISMNDISGIEF